VNLRKAPVGGRDGMPAIFSLMETVRAFAIVTISAGISAFQQLLQAFLARV